MTEPGTPQGQLPSRHRAAIPLILIALFTIVLICLGIELYTRHSIGSQVADSISADINKNCTGHPYEEHSCRNLAAPGHTAIGGKPILFGLSSKTLPQINVTIGPMPPADMRAGTLVEFDAKGINYADKNNLHFDSAHATLTIPPATLKNVINNELKKQGGLLADSATVTAVNYQPTSSSVDLIFNDGFAKFSIIPTVRDGNFSFELKDVAIAGFHNNTLVDALRAILPELSGEYVKLLPANFTAESVTIKDNSIVVELNGKDFTSQDLIHASAVDRK